MAINAQYAWEVCLEAVETGRHVRVVCDDGAKFEGIPSHVDFDYVIVGGKGFAHGQIDYIEVVD